MQRNTRTTRIIHVLDDVVWSEKRLTFNTTCDRGPVLGCRMLTMIALTNEDDLQAAFQQLVGVMPAAALI